MNYSDITQQFMLRCHGKAQH